MSKPIPGSEQDYWGVYDDWERERDEEALYALHEQEDCDGPPECPWCLDEEEERIAILRKETEDGKEG